MARNNIPTFIRRVSIFILTTALSITTDTYGATPNIEIGVRLYAQNENLLLRFENGNSVLFKPSGNTFGHRLLKNQSHSNERLGRIDTHNTKRIWHSEQNVKIEFLGSYPIAVSTDEHHVSLNYQQRKLTHASFLNQNYAPPLQIQAQIIDQIRSLLEQAEQSACAAESGDEQCTDPEAPLPVGFGTNQDADELHIDTRPSDCHSYFTAYPSIERGTQIEAALASHPPYFGSASGSHSFPVADYWNNGNVYVLISRDLTSDSYQSVLNPDGFYEQLIADGENIDQNLIQPLEADGQISQTSLGETTTLYREEAQVIYLDVVVQYGVMSDEQKDQFDRAAAELLRRYGIVLRLIMIP